MAANSNITSPAGDADTTAPAHSRVVAIDALRGFDMFWIMGGREALLTFVEAIKGKESVPAWLSQQFEHREWQGFTAWDLIMPLFLFVVGAAMPFSFARRLEEGGAKGPVYAKIIRRTAILFVLGMAVQGHLLDFDLATLHVFANTLQAIAVGYLVAGIAMLNLRVVWQVAIAAALLIGYWLLLRYIPFAGHSAGTLEPKANLALAVDELVLGRFRDGTTYTWVLSSLTFSVSVMLGVFAGYVLRSSLTHWQKFATLVGLGAGCLAAGFAWEAWLGLPIIKHIWTSSMTLWAGGWSYLLLALFYVVIDIAGFRRWAFAFVVIGMNAITAYVAWHFIPFTEIAESLVGGLARHLGPWGPFVVALAACGLCWLILYDLFRRRVFLRI